MPRHFRFTRDELVTAFRRWDEQAEEEGWEDNPPDPEVNADCLIELLKQQRRRLCAWPFEEALEAYDGALMMSTSIQVGGSTTAQVAYTNKDGGSASVVGVPKWQVAPPDIIIGVTPAADGMSAAIAALAAGVATVTVTAEGDPTPGVDTITLSGVITVTAEEASGGTLTFGTPPAAAAIKLSANSAAAAVGVASVAPVAATGGVAPYSLAPGAPAGVTYDGTNVSFDATTTAFNGNVTVQDSTTPVPLTAPLAVVIA